MNYENIAKEIARDLAMDSAHIPIIGGLISKPIERACLEAQLEIISKIHKRKNIAYSVCGSLGNAYSESIACIEDEIQSKLKAMKP